MAKAIPNSACLSTTPVIGGADLAERGARERDREASSPKHRTKPRTETKCSSRMSGFHVMMNALEFCLEALSHNAVNQNLVDQESVARHSWRSIQSPLPRAEFVGGRVERSSVEVPAGDET